jgi:FkbM family methyltransferase
MDASGPASFVNKCAGTHSTTPHGSPLIPRWPFNLRRLLELASRGVVLKRQLPRQCGGCSIYVTPDAALTYWRRDVSKADPTLLKLAVETIRPGSTVWDIGANVGLFSIAAASLSGPAGRVYAIEPDPTLAELLRRSASANPHSASLQVLSVAISDALGLTRFVIAERGRASNHLEGYGHSQSSGGRSVQLVMTITLDWLLTQLPVPDVLKIDIEGAELALLNGARKVLERRPTIICEVGQQSQQAVTRILAEYGDLIYDGDTPPENRSPVALAPWTTLAVQHPNE